MSLSSAIVVLSFSSYVTAQGYVFSATPLETAYLVVWSFSGLIYFIQTILTIIALVFSGGHRLPYAMLIVAVIMSHLSSIAAIVQTVVDFNGVAFPSPEFTTASAVAFNLFLNWAQVFLFVSIMSLLFNRHSALHAASGGLSGKPHIAAKIALGVFTLLLFALGVAQAALQGVYFNALSALLSDGTIDSQEAEIAVLNAGNNSQNMNIVFNSFIISSVLFVIVYAVVLYKRMNRSGVSDKVTNMMVLGITPLYTAYIIINLAFTIIFVIAVDSNFDLVNFIWALLINLFYTTIVMFLVVLGMNRSIWVIPSQGTPTVPTEPVMMMGAWPQQGYYYYPTQSMPAQFPFQPATWQPQPPAPPIWPQPQEPPTQTTLLSPDTQYSDLAPEQPQPQQQPSVPKVEY